MYYFCNALLPTLIKTMCKFATLLYWNVTGSETGITDDSFEFRIISFLGDNNFKRRAL